MLSSVYLLTIVLCKNSCFCDKKKRMNERVIFGHNPLDQSTLKLFSWKSNQIISVKIKPKYPWLLMLKVHNRGVGNSTPQHSFRIHNFNGAILLNVELSCLSFKGCATTHIPKKLRTLNFFFQSALNFGQHFEIIFSKYVKFGTSLTHFEKIQTPLKWPILTHFEKIHGKI